MKVLKYHQPTIVVSILALFFCGLLFSCSVKKDSFFHRAYHGTTARFNIVFNGQESYLEGIEALELNHKDNYTSILPVFPKSDKTLALQQANKWDRTIEKCSKAIKKHSMLIKGIERCKPIDDAYLLLGKAYFQRQDYADALGVFNYVINTHHNGNVWADAFSWKAETLLKQDRSAEAEEVLEENRANIANTKSHQYKQHWEGVFADLLIEQEDYENASVYLSELLKNKRMKKDFKTRVYFILAQVQQHLEQNEEASKNYLAALKRNPIYEMEFNATLNLALCSDDFKQSREKLKRLFKDERNETFKDQIFYTLAQIDLAESDTVAAINNLEASVFWNIENQYQKTQSSLKLAEIYFQRTQYINSLTHYDTAVASLSSDYPNYLSIKKRVGILKSLVSELMVINTQDSLLKVSNMSEGERNDYASKQVAAYKQREKEKLEDEAEKTAMMEQAKTKRATAAAATNAGNTTWIFANPTKTKQGIQEFRKQWGSRTLEDYWFLESISISSFGQDVADNSTSEDEGNTTQNDNTTTQTDKDASSASGNRSTNPNEAKYYLQDVPLEAKAKEKSHQDIANALYNSGFIYFDDLNEKEKANKQWEDLISRYPNHKLVAPSCFQLYHSYTALNNTEKSNYYKNKILSDFSQTVFAKIIENPNYYQELLKQEQEAELYYQNVYQEYEKQNYAQVVSLIDVGLKKFISTDLHGKMELMKALCLGKTNGNQALREGLNKVVSTYPATIYDTVATDYLAALDRLEKPETNQQQTITAKQPKEETANYVYDGKAFHFVIIFADIKEIRFDQLKNNIADFNKEFFRKEKFDVSSFYIDNTLNMVTIAKFANQSKAMDYYRLLKTDKTYFDKLNKSKATVYVISDANYITFSKNKEKRADYEQFFIENYLKK